MPFTVRDFHDFVAILEKKPEWRAELRRLVLTDDILRLPEIVKELVEAQKRTEEELRSLSSKVDSLAEAQRRTEEELKSLTARVDSLTQRVDSLAARVDSLAEAQRRTEEELKSLTSRVDSLAAQMETLTARVDSLTQRVDSLTARVDSLAEAQRRTEEELKSLAARVDSLAEAQRKTEEELRSLTARVDSLTQRVDSLAAQMEVLTARVDSLTQRVDSLAEAQRRTEETVRRLVIDVGELKGDSLERKYRERAAVYFGRLLRKLRVMPFEELREMVDGAVDEGKLSEDEAEDVLGCDFVARGLRKEDGVEEHLLVEVSWGIGVGDVERALRRAEILGKLGLEVVPVVAGKGLTPEARDLAERRGVGVVVDGRVRLRPGRPRTSSPSSSTSF